MKLLRDDRVLQAAIRRTLGALSVKRHWTSTTRDGIGAELFSEEEARLCTAIEAARIEASNEQAQDRIQNELEAPFDRVAALLRDLDIETVWIAVEEQERRVLVEELVEARGGWPAPVCAASNSSHWRVDLPVDRKLLLRALCASRN